MTRYLISFDDGAMTFPEEDLPDVAQAARAVVREATDAGVCVFGGGLHSHDERPSTGLGGSPSPAVCAQEVREFVPGSTR